MYSKQDITILAWTLENRRIQKGKYKTIWKNEERQTTIHEFNTKELQN